MDDRSLRIAVLLSAHLIFLSAGALRILRGQRAHLLVAEAPWWLQYYPPLVWIPFVVSYVQPLAIDLDPSLRFVGLAIAAASAAGPVSGAGASVRSRSTITNCEAPAKTMTLVALVSTTLSPA